MGKEIRPKQLELKRVFANLQTKWSSSARVENFSIKGALQKSFVVLIIGNSKSNHLGAQGTFEKAN